MSAEATGRPWAVDDELPPNDRTVIVRCGHAGVPISGNTSGYDASRSRASYNAEDRANAHLIVEAVNSHAALLSRVAELEVALSTLQSENARLRVQVEISISAYELQACMEEEGEATRRGWRDLAKQARSALEGGK